MRILVLDGNENQAVACVRSLGKAGHAVFVGADSSWSKAGWSRYCRGSFSYPGPQVDIDAFISRIIEEVRREEGTLILPMTERTTLPLSGARDLIYAAGGKLVLPDHKNVLRAFDKQQTIGIARSLGIAVPETKLIMSEREAAESAESLPFPVVLKPRSSEVSASGRIKAAGRPLYASNKPEFLKAHREMSARNVSILVQEFVEGRGSGYFALMREGEPRAEFAHRRVRDVHPTGSGSAVRVSITPDPVVREAALSILKALNWHGVAMVEFRIRPDGTPVFMEVNGRFWTSLPLAVYAGVDFPQMLAEMAEMGDCERTSGYRENVRCRWLLGDARHLVEVMRGAPSGYPGRFPNRWSTLAEFLLPVRGAFHDNFMLSDPFPEAGDWLDFGIRKLFPRLLKQTSIERIDVEGRYSHS